MIRMISQTVNPRKMHQRSSVRNRVRGVRARSARILIISLKYYEYYCITHSYHCTLDNYEYRSCNSPIYRRMLRNTKLALRARTQVLRWLMRELSMVNDADVDPLTAVLGCKSQVKVGTRIEIKRMTPYTECQIEGKTARKMWLIVGRRWILLVRCVRVRNNTTRMLRKYLTRALRSNTGTTRETETKSIEKERGKTFGSCTCYF